MRIINEAGLRIVKSFEGCRLRAYQDIGGVWTIGYGSTRNVQPGQTITQDQADDRLLEDLAMSESEVQTHITVSLTDNQFSALVSLVFNCGIGPLIHTLGSKLNNSDYSGASNEFLRWDTVNGDVVSGLYDRRVAERNLFLTK